ncbi:nucleotidyltransferase domain-containing protein [archaeon]|jgi:predicted nucleotidyltransferase|nr:nucleotidyltransferase domain-containing protein [Candidatus Woesearchaeota archaeon]MBT4136059.1 nucleotidyltransferase domain-containing protein [archaeon]MBT4241284.1 nucleotidyltransferase domain-containing protein [archaeon]MBT4418106.1 nucleotidyltransferase domain-containing protein [archaeon]
MELIKQTIKVGNSAGVLLPKQYLNSKVKIILEPLNIEKDVLDILIEEDLLKNVKGIYLTGSYVREEQTIESDIDILVITDKINKRLKKGKYDILLVSSDKIEERLNKNILPIIPMLREAKVIINNSLREEYLEEIKLNWKNLKWHVESTESAMKVVKEDIGISQELNEKVSNASVYSLILRLRTIYILDCLIKNKLWKKEGLLKLIKKISGSLDSYEIYEDIKNNKKRKDELSIQEAEKLMNYIIKKTEEIKKWLKERKD